MHGKAYIGVVSFCLGLFPVLEASACSWDLNGVGYPPSCGYRGGGGGRVAPAPYVPPPPSPAQIAAQQARAINENGLRAEKAGNLALAISLYEQALRLSPSNSFANNLAHARAEAFDKQGIEAERAGNSVLALRLFEQAMQALPADRYYDPSRVTLRSNIAKMRAQLEEQQGRERQQQQDKVAASNMEQSIRNLAQSLNTTASTGGLDFKDAAGNKPEPSGGLQFMTAKPAAAGDPGNSAATTIQLNPGAKFEKAPEVTVSGAHEANSAREQLFTSRFESTGQLFDNGRGHDDAAVDARLANVATPPAQTIDARFAKNKDYQAATTELAKVQAAADALNKKMADLLSQQNASPTPERQAEIYNLSGQLHQASGAVTIATTNLDAVKKKIIQDGPPIVVEDGASSAAQPAPTGK